MDVRRRQIFARVAVPLLALAGLTGGAAGAPVVFPGNGHSYELVLDGDISWDGAQAAARASGRELATITSAQEQAFVEDLLLDSGAPTGSYWFGLRETQTEGEYAWATGETFSYDNFAPGEPNNGGGESYGGIYWTADGGPAGLLGRRGGWNDLPLQGYPNALASPDQVDLFRAGYVVEAADTGGEPTPIPLPAAVWAAAPAAVVAAFAARRMKRRRWM